MSVRAKFKCVEKTQQISGFNVRLEPVLSGSVENSEFYKYTPSGKCEIGTINQKAADGFEVGKEYYLDFTPAD